MMRLAGMPVSDLAERPDLPHAGSPGEVPDGGGHDLACFRSRRAAAGLQAAFFDRLARHARAGLAQSDVPEVWREQVMPALLDYGVMRSKKRLSVEATDFAQLLQQAERLDRRRAGAGERVGEGAAPAGPERFLHSLRDVVETAYFTLQESEDRAVDAMVARHQDRPAFYDRELFRGEDRLYFDLPKPDSKVAPQIQAALTERGYGELDYENGLVRNPYGDNARIGKALQKLKLLDLYDAFKEDPARHDPMVVMLSRRSEDVARMSTGREWSRCIVAGSARFERHMPADLKHGVLVAYLVRPNDPEAHEPVARIGLKPYRNEAGQTILVPNKVFGKADERFSAFVKSVVEEAVNAGKTGTFHLDRSMLSDDLDYQVERGADGTISSKLTLMPEPPVPTGRQLPPGTRIGDRITI